MTDERTESGMQPGGGFDDDRLLALALGLDDDPELLAAAEGDAELAGRLAAMRADVALIGAQVGAAVPAPDEGYTDLSGERWSGLSEFFEPPARVAKPRRERRWWRVAAPVTALVVLALVVGIVAVNGGGGILDAARRRRWLAPPPTPPSPRPPRTYGAGATEKTTGGRIADTLDRFAVIVLARARQATGALQRFAVLRIFKGDAPQRGGTRGRRQARRPGPAAPAHARPGGHDGRGERGARAHPLARHEPRASRACPASR